MGLAGTPWWKIRGLNPGRTIAKSTAVTPYKAVATTGKMGLEALPKYGERPVSTVTGQLLGAGEGAIPNVGRQLGAGQAAAQTAGQSGRNIWPWLIAGGAGAAGIGAYLTNQQREQSPYSIPFERPPVGIPPFQGDQINLSTAQNQPAASITSAQIPSAMSPNILARLPSQNLPIPQMIGQGAGQSQDIPLAQDIYGDPNAGKYASIAGLLGQLGQAATARDPNSLGYQLGGIATRAAQAQLYNRYLSQLIGGGGGAQGAPSFPQVSGLESFSLSPEAQTGAQNQLEQSRSNDVDRLYKLALMTGVETPEQLLNRQIMTNMISGKGQSNLQLVHNIKVGADGKPTKTPQSWYADPTTGKLVQHVGEDFKSEGDGGAASGVSQQNLYLRADNQARQLALMRLKTRYPNEITFDPATQQYDIGTVPPGSQLIVDLNSEYGAAIKFYQGQNLLPKGWESIAGASGVDQQVSPSKYIMGEPKKEEKK